MEKQNTLFSIFNRDLAGWQLTNGCCISLNGLAPYLAIGGEIVFTDDFKMASKIANLLTKKEKRQADEVSVVKDMMLYNREEKICFFLESGKNAAAWRYFSASELEVFLKNPTNYKWELPFGRQKHT